jgi:hypothetical protein
LATRVDLLRKLTIAMADLDAEPDDETIELAQRLRTEPTGRCDDASGQ